MIIFADYIFIIILLRFIFIFAIYSFFSFLRFFHDDADIFAIIIAVIFADTFRRFLPLFR